MARAVRRKNVEPTSAEPPAPEPKTRKARAVKSALAAEDDAPVPARKTRSKKAVPAEAAEPAVSSAVVTSSSSPSGTRAYSISASNLPWANTAAKSAAAPAVRPRRERREKGVSMAQRLQEELEAVEASITRINDDG